MPSSDASLQFALMNAGIPTGNAIDIASKVGGGAVAAITSGTIAGTAITTSSVAATTLSASAAVALSPASANVVISPTGTGVVTVAPATAGTLNNVSLGQTTPLAVTATALTATGAVTMSSASQAITMSPTGTGTITINPGTLGQMDNVLIGNNTPAIGKFSNLRASPSTDISGTPGNGTSNGFTGRAAFAAGTSTVTITNSGMFSGASRVFVNLESTDATLTSCRVTSVATGSFVVTGNANATATTIFTFLAIG